MKSVHLIISGDVQGVGFRKFIAYHAKKRNIQGWVKNRSDGTVEAEIYGEPQYIDELIALCHEGPEISMVEDVFIEVIINPPTRKDFQIIK